MRVTGAGTAAREGAGLSMRVAAFNALGRAEAERELAACCAAPAWTAAVAAGRPYAGPVQALAASDAAFARLSWADIALAVAAHPRIGEPAAGASREAAWSRGEQSGVAAAAHRTRAALAEGNREYERRFGHTFLICASGLSADEMLAALRARLGNDEAAERAVVREELRRIARLRLERMLAG
jgi:2-oxo-4-hydroxy-4-carboxy-5-ureidoimidazoline decarboxylase